MKRLVMLVAIIVVGLSMKSYANCVSDLAHGINCDGNGTGNNGGGQQGPQGNSGVNGSNGLNGLNGLDAVNQSRFLGELDLRLWDTKRTSFYAFDSYGFNDAPGNDVVMDGRNAFYGFKFVVKLGSSYEERLAEKQDARIKALEAVLAKLSK